MLTTAKHAPFDTDHLLRRHHSAKLNRFATIIFETLNRGFRPMCNDRATTLLERMLIYPTKSIRKYELIHEITMFTCSRLGVKNGGCSVYHKTNRETMVEIGDSVRGKDIYIIQTGTK